MAEKILLKESRFGNFGLIVANSHYSLGMEIAAELGVVPLQIESGFYENKELNVRRLCDVSGMDICIVGSLHSQYDTLKEYKLILDSVDGANRKYGVLSFVRDGKSDHIKRYGEQAAYKNTAMEISRAGADLIAIFDQHTSQHPYYYDTIHYRLRKVHHIYLMRILIEFIMEQTDSFDSVLALDDGGFKKNNKFAEMLNKPVSFIIKYRDPHSRIVDIEKSKIVGDVKGHSVVSFDDMVQKGGTIEVGSKIAKHNGAKSFTGCMVHNDFCDETFDKINPLLEDGTIDKLYILETIPLQNKEKWHKNLIVLSPAKFMAKVIAAIHNEDHMRQFFLEI